jgi:hypothetical protein
LRPATPEEVAGEKLPPGAILCEKVEDVFRPVVDDEEAALVIKVAKIIDPLAFTVREFGDEVNRRGYNEAAELNRERATEIAIDVVRAVRDGLEVDALEREVDRLKDDLRRAEDSRSD